MIKTHYVTSQRININVFKKLFLEKCQSLQMKSCIYSVLKYLSYRRKCRDGSVSRVLSSGRIGVSISSTQHGNLPVNPLLWQTHGIF